MTDEFHSRLIRQILAYFQIEGGWRVMLADLPEEVQPGVLLMKRLLAGDTALQEQALLGLGVLGASGPLGMAYRAREVRNHQGESGSAKKLVLSSIWAELDESERSLLLADGWTERVYEAFMVFSDGVCYVLPQALPGKKRSQPRRLLGHFIRCAVSRCECCELSPYVEGLLKAAGSPLVAS